MTDSDEAEEPLPRCEFTLDMFSNEGKDDESKRNTDTNGKNESDRINGQAHKGNSGSDRRR